MNVFMVFLALVFAHYLADYPLQGDYLASTKGDNPHSLIAHTSIWTGSIAIMGLLVGLPITLLGVALLFVVHFIADYAKANKLVWYGGMSDLKALTIDQAIHFGQIVVYIFLMM